MEQHTIPLSSGFMLLSIVGFLISTFYIVKLSETWAFTLSLVFVIMFLASIITMSKAAAEIETGLKELSIHDKHHYTKKTKKGGKK
jgi:Mn2+/Fe2+ NRAMP family transporter